MKKELAVRELVLVALTKTSRVTQTECVYVTSHLPQWQPCERGWEGRPPSISADQGWGKEGRRETSTKVIKLIIFIVTAVS